MKAESTGWAAEVGNPSVCADTSPRDDYDVSTVTNPRRKLTTFLIHNVRIITQLRHTTATFVLVWRQSRRIVDSHLPAEDMKINVKAKMVWILDSSLMGNTFHS